MKKLLLVLAIGAFVACNDNAGTEDATSDTTTTAPATVPPVDTTTTAPMDTTSSATPADTTVQN